jgi:hypothetical protein
MTDDIKLRIGKLLNQAERASTEAEKEAFYERAFKLSATHSIELAQARAAIAKLEKREQPVMKTIHIGEQGQHNLAVFCNLFMNIGEPHGIKFNISSKSTYVIAFGMPSDIELTETLYETIVPQMMKSAQEFIAGGTWKGETTLRDGRDGWGHYPINSRVVKRNFYETFARTIRDRMYSAQREAREEAIEHERAQNVEATEEEPAATTGTEMVLADKALEIADFYSQKSRARGTWKGSSNTYTSNAGRSGGRAAGQRASLSGTRSLPGGKKQLG